MRKGESLHLQPAGYRAMADLHTAVALVRPVGDPVMFLRAAAALLPIDGDDTLLAEATAAGEAINVALPHEALARAFQEGEPARAVRRSETGPVRRSETTSQ